MRLLALDVGERRIGLASGVGEVGAALPAGVIRRTRLAADVRAVLDAARQRQSDVLVVGVPFAPAGRSSPQTKYVRGFIRAPQTRVAAARSRSRRSLYQPRAEGLCGPPGMQPSRDRGAIDETAAVLILRRFLDKLDKTDC